MKRFHSFGGWVLALWALAVCTSAALGLGGDHPTGKLVAQHDDWPAGLVDLVNEAGRVRGHWVNQNDFFYYQGDAAALNKFLARYAKLSDTPLTVVLHLAEDQRTGPLGKAATDAFDWKLEVIRRGWGAPLEPLRPKDKPGYVVTVHVWLGSTITLKKLEVPRDVKIQSAGDLEAFIKDHAKRK